jgi:hypothetical protein
LTHQDLVESAYKWVLSNTPCNIAFKELVSWNSTGEIPDVIGFGSNGFSVLIECKVSRSDFLVDQRKSFRIYPHHGMGSQRFYCCPIGLLKKEDLPKGWGLIYVDDKLKARANYKPNKGNPQINMDGWFEKNIRAEHELMYSALRRLQFKGIFDEIYYGKENNK